MSLFHFSFRKETGPENMATDMWLLNRVEQWQRPVFRRYGWLVPQVTFGYGQKADWVEQETGLSLSFDPPTDWRRNCSSWEGPDLLPDCSAVARVQKWHRWILRTGSPQVGRSPLGAGYPEQSHALSRKIKSRNPWRLF